MFNSLLLRDRILEGLEYDSLQLASPNKIVGGIFQHYEQIALDGPGRVQPAHGFNRLKFEQDVLSKILYVCCL